MGPRISVEFLVSKSVSVRRLCNALQPNHNDHFNERSTYFGHYLGIFSSYFVFGSLRGWIAELVFTLQQRTYYKRSGIQ